MTINIDEYSKQFIGQQDVRVIFSTLDCSQHRPVHRLLKKRGANLRFLKSGRANLKQNLILRPKLGVLTQFLVQNCMMLK